MNDKIFKRKLALVSITFVLQATGGALAPHASETRFAIIGDAGQTNSNSRSVRESIARQGVKRLVLPGDNLYSSDYASVWKPWKEAGLSFDVVAIGNHTAGYQKEIAFFQMPGEYFSKVVNGIRFVVLNSDNNSTGSKQANWLDRELAAASEKYIFLVYHHPTYTISRFHRWEEKKKFQKALRPVIWKHRSKLTALLVGHDHLASVLHFDDLPVILSGAVQDLRNDSPVNNIQDGVTVRTAWYFDKAPYWARLTADPDKPTVQIDFVRSRDDRNSCTVLLTPGKSAELQKNCTITGFGSDGINELD